jgi:hypothetical protein
MLTAARRRLATLARPAALALACLALAPAQASHVGDDLLADQQVVQSTNQLVAALRQWQSAPANVRAQLESRLTQLAQQRRERLLRLLERNPRLAAMRFLPGELAAAFPSAARAQFEQAQALSGPVFASVADDFARGVSRKEFKIESAAGNALTLHLADPDGSERDLLAWAGRTLRAQGTVLGANFVVHDKHQAVAAEGTTTTATGTSTGTLQAAVSGDQNTLVILANFTDRALSCTAADVSARVFGATGATVNNGFRESSRQAVSFSGQVVGPVNIPYSYAGSCEPSAWGSAAETAVRALGIDPSRYQRVNYVTPPNSTCGWSGMAYMPGRQSWVQACGATGVFTHELGHNLSLHHSSTPSAEYGDGSDPMGGARTVRNNGANQVMAGWMPAGSVLDVASAGSYTLAPLGPEAGSAPQVLRLAKADTAEVYYVSLRQANGLDANLGSGYLNNLAIHRSTGRLPARTYLLQSVAPGASFVDAVNGITITNQGVSPGAATVAVAFGGGSCVREVPTVAVSPISASGAPGTAVNYTVAVTNRDSSTCGTGSFALASVLPAGFSGNFGTAALSIAPGASASTSWRVQSAIGTAEATYTLDVSAAESGAAAGTAHASYVAVIDTAGPTLGITNLANGSVLAGRGQLAISATASDPSGVSVVEFYVDGKLIGADRAPPYSANWNLRKAAAGPHVVRVRAVDMVGNATEVILNVTIQ